MSLRPLPLSAALAVVPVVLALLLAACASGGGSSAGQAPAGTTASTASPSTTATTTATTDARPANGCRPTGQPGAKPDGGRRRPRRNLPRGVRLSAVVATNCGAFTIALDTRRSLRTSSSFAALARARFFDGTTFHRIVPGFVIQGGDPTGTGTGGPGYTVVEPPARTQRYPRYAVAMAKTGNEPRGASGSQFFVVTSSQGGAQLTPDYALLGRVTRGTAVVDRLGALPADPQTGRPQTPAVIESIRIRAGG